MTESDPGHVPYAAFFGYMGIVAAQTLTVIGASFGTAKAGVGICSMGVMRPELVFKSLIPIIMAGKIYIISIFRVKKYIYILSK